MMKRFMHTPGPWAVEHHGGPWHIFGRDDVRIGTYTTSIPARTDEQFAEARANARLIAAAPDLLSVAHVALSRLVSVSDFSDERSEASQLQRSLRAAIAKAEEGTR